MIRPLSGKKLLTARPTDMLSPLKYLPSPPTQLNVISSQVAYATNSIIELNPTVLADADAKDAERATCAPNCNLSKIHGIPVLLKDNVAADGMNVTAGELNYKRKLTHNIGGGRSCQT